MAVLAGLYGLNSAWWAILLYHAGIAVALSRRPEVLRRLGRGVKPRWMLVGGMAAAAVAAVAVWWGVPMVLGPSGGSRLALALNRCGVVGVGRAIFGGYFVTVHPVLEELAWRGLIAGERRPLDRGDVEFAAYHLLVLQRLFPGEWMLLALAMGGLMLLAGFWRELARRTGGLAVPVCVHAGADAGLLLAAFGLAFSNSPA